MNFDGTVRNGSMNILKAEGEVRRSGRARRSTRKGDRKRKRGEEDEDELEELEERKPTRQSKRSKSKAKKQASSDEEGDVSFIFCFWVWSLYIFRWVQLTWITDLKTGSERLFGLFWSFHAAHLILQSVWMDGNSPGTRSGPVLRFPKPPENGPIKFACP